MRQIPSVLTVLLLTSFAFGQTAVSSQAATKEDVMQMFQEMRFEQKMKGIQQNISSQFQAMAGQMMQGPEFRNLPPDRQQRFQEFMAQEMQKSMNLYPISEIMDDFAPVYAKHLTKADVQGIIDFYHSPAGKKLLDVSPIVSQEAMAIIGPKMQDRVEKAMDEMQHRMQELLNEPASPTPPQNRN